MSSVSLEVDLANLREIVAVELPCLSSNADTAIKCLGGDKLNLSANHIYFNFPHIPEQGGALLGVKEAKQGLLLKVTRDKRTNETSVDVVGKINHMFTFTNPADFQLTLHDEPPLYESSKLLRGHFPTYISNPYPNIFVDVRKDAQAEKFRNKTVRIKFGDAIPQSFPNLEDFTKHPARSRGGAVKGLVEEYLSARPICVLHQLLSVQKCRKYAVERVLVQRCYSFVGGPWNTCWVPYGYDPTQDPLNRIWQVSYSKMTRSQLIKIRNRVIKLSQTVNLEGKVINLDTMSLQDHGGVFKREYEYAREITLVPIVAFGNLLKGYFSAQIAHVLDETFMQLATSTPFSNKINTENPSSGFFATNDLNDIRRAIRSLIIRKLDAFCNNPTSTPQPSPYTIDNMKVWRKKYEDAARKSNPTVQNSSRSALQASSVKKKRKIDDVSAAVSSIEGTADSFEVFGDDSDDDSDYSSDDLEQYMEKDACFDEDDDDDEDED